MTHNATIPDLMQSPCPQCAMPQPGGARFCADCGDALPEALPVVPTPRQSSEPMTDAAPAVPAEYATASARRPGSGRRRIVAIVLVVAAVAGVGVLALNDRGTHQRLAASRSAFATSQSRLSATRNDLAKTAAQLASAKADLTSTESTLASTKASLATAQKTLAAKEQDLVGVRNNLTQVKNSVTMQAGQIETLKSCLNGVSIALGDVAQGDYSGAISALDAVQVSCDAAYALF